MYIYSAFIMKQNNLCLYQMREKDWIIYGHFVPISVFCLILFLFSDQWLIVCFSFACITVPESAKRPRKKSVLSRYASN